MVVASVVLVVIDIGCCCIAVLPLVLLEPLLLLLVVGEVVRGHGLEGQGAASSRNACVL